MLLDAGANTSLRSKADETAIDWAKKFQHPGVLAALKLSPETPRRGRPMTVTPGRPHTRRRRGWRSNAVLPLLRDASGRC